MDVSHSLLEVVKHLTAVMDQMVADNLALRTRLAEQEIEFQAKRKTFYATDCSPSERNPLGQCPHQVSRE
jgi:hypothetical protein